MQHKTHTNDNIIKILLKKDILIDMFKPQAGLSVASPMDDHAAFAFKIYGKPYLHAGEKQPIARPMHGMQHVAAVAMYVPVFANLYIKYGCHEAARLTAEDLKLTQIAALFHDAARESDGVDRWDHESGLIIYLYLHLVLKVTHHKAKMLAEASANKDMAKQGYCMIDADEIFIVRYQFEPYYRPTKNIYQKLIHDSDCLDVIRARAEYDGTYLDFYQAIACFNAQALDDVAEVIAEAKSFITLRGDAYANLDMTRKLQFEHADVYSSQYALLDERHPMLRQFAVGLLTRQALHARIIDQPTADKTQTLTASYLSERMRSGMLLGRAIPFPSCPTSKNAKETRGELEVRKVKRVSGNPLRSLSMMSYGNGVYANAGFLLVNPDPANVVEAKALDFNTGRGKKEKYRENLVEEREFLLEHADPTRSPLAAVNRQLKLGGRGVLCERFLVTQSEIVLRSVHRYDAIFVCHDATFHNYDATTHDAHAATYYAPLLQAIYLRQVYGGVTPLPLFEYSGTHHYIREIAEEKLSDEWILRYWEHAAKEYMQKLIDANKSLEIYQMTLASLKIACVYGTIKHSKKSFNAPDQKYPADLVKAVDQALTTVMHQSFAAYLSKRLQIIKMHNDFTGYRETCLLAARCGDLAYLQTVQSRLQTMLFDVEIKQLSPLHIAAEYNQLSVLRWMLTIVPADFAHAVSVTALGCAADQAAWEAVTVLLQHGANPNQYRHVEGTLLHMATAVGALPMMQQCLDVGLDANQGNITGWTPMHMAARYGQVAAMAMLLSVKVDINILNGADETPLHLAAKFGQLAMVEYLLAQGADSELFDCGRKTALIHALLSGHAEVVQALIQAGASLSTHPKYYSTLLHDAAYAENLEMMALLVAHQPELLRSTDDEGYTPLHNTIEFKRMKSLQWLIQHGADMNACEKSSGITPLQLSIGHWYEGFCYLLQCGAATNIKASNGETPLYRALMVNKVKYVQPLLRVNQAELSEYVNGSMPLHIAVRQRNLAITTLLLQQGAAIEAKDREQLTPLQLALHAVTGPNLPMMSLLLEHGADDKDVYLEAINREISAISTLNAFRHFASAIELGNLRAVRFHLQKDKDRPDAIFLAIRYGKENVLRYLLQRGYRHDTALHEALHRNQRGCIIALFEFGVDIEKLNQNNMTALQCAVENTRVDTDIMRILIAKAARVENSGKIGYTPLQLAVSVQSVSKAQLLLESGANITIKCRHQRTLLHKAVSKNNSAMVKVLLCHQADIHSKDCNGNTALHLAAEHAQRDIVTMLLKAGADPHIKNNKGHLPEKLAKKSGSDDLYQVLRQSRKQAAAIRYV